MKLSQNSISAKLYRWFYLIDTMPENLCPYFWKLVVMWIFIIPYFILTLPTVILEKRGRADLDNAHGARILIGVALYIGLAFIVIQIFSLSIFWVQFKEESPARAFQMTGITAWCIILGIVVLRLIKLAYLRINAKLHLRRLYDKDGNYLSDNVVIKPKSDNIIIGFIKSKYHKYCPKIDWF